METTMSTAVSFAICLWAASPAENLITNPGFDQGLADWIADRIAAETLAVDIASARDLAYKDTFKHEDDEIGIALERV